MKYIGGYFIKGRSVIETQTSQFAIDDYNCPF
jgi:hypothetical protein